MRKVFYPVIMFLLQCVLLTGCNYNKKTVCENTIFEGWLGEKYDEETQTMVQEIKDDRFLLVCPIESEKLVLPSTFSNYGMITGVGDHSFCNDNTIVSLVIPDGYWYVGMGAFENCANLKSVTLGKDVSLITELAFANCPNLCEFIIPEGNEHFYTSEGCLLKKDTDTLLISNGTIPLCTKIIGPSVFVANENIREMFVPEGVIQISPLAFNESSLSSITLPESLLSLGWSAFQGCDALKELYIPDNVTEVGEKLFSMCEQGITVYCEAESKPDGWSDDWLVGSENVTVIWGYTPEE